MNTEPDPLFYFLQIIVTTQQKFDYISKRIEANKGLKDLSIDKAHHS